ncbi:MAG: tetratricopeptide repeat protein, partial [Lentisphaerae bacterium]|nr:tetratricopeptide repeat protein [Lentisphaerota bacterium]
EPLLAEHPREPQFHIAYAEILRLQDRRDAADAHLRNALDSSGWTEPLLLWELFAALWNEERYDDAAALLKRARRAPGLRGHFLVDHAEAMLNASLLEARADSLSRRQARRLAQRALKAARQAAVQAPAQARAADLEALAALLIELDAPATAAAMLRNARIARQGEPPPELLVVEAQALQLSGCLEWSLDLAEGLRRRDDLTPPLYGAVAALYADNDRLDDAALVYEEALRRFPEAGLLRAYLAHLYLRLDRPAKGLDALKGWNDPPVIALRLTAYLQRALGHGKAALESLQRAEANARETDGAEDLTADVCLFAATLCEEQGQIDQAIDYARRAVDQAPDDPSACNFLGYLLADHNRDLDTAAELIIQAVTAEPDNDAFLDSLAWVRFRQGRLDEAHAAMNRAIAAGMPAVDGVILDHAGDIADALGLHHLARWYWTRALTAGVPNADAIRTKLNPAPAPQIPAHGK